MDDENQQHAQDARDTVGVVGESTVLDRIVRRLPTAQAATLGPGDDCAVVAAPDGRFVVTTDMMVHGPDFRWAWSSPYDLGWKAAATNLSDVAAMGARPSSLVVALAVPQDTPVAVLEAFADGLADACGALAPGCGVVGGDLSTSGTFTIAVTAFGDLEGRAPVLRSGATVGDQVAVAGELGAAARGLTRLFAEGVDEHGAPDAGRTAAFLAASPGGSDHGVDRQRRPEPPIVAGVLAAAAGATAMLDLSDGLAIDAGRLARASGVSIDLDPAAVPDAASLFGGEDHGLFATYPAATILPAAFRRIGTVVDAAGEPGVLLAGEPVGTAGWDPYADWDGNVG
ncbi:thiamine-phosphate kinase [Curtobacterium sp. Leaf261]|uniref:thiamine-phosphate kinase n=1 Tax=Curtobacterium sp. Leaf261 TaxID=1736311 RepID=UPI0006FA98A3|nr:thiamine-phosphate kinase [Curtobacterium sp. Leaf261]KQO60192.1 thiamine-monophosphate kinase [Curtobacterium sp. Leaf261]